MSGKYSTGSPPAPQSRRIPEDEWKQLLAEKRTPTDGHRVPTNILVNPIKLPPMERVKK